MNRLPKSSIWMRWALWSITAVILCGSGALPAAEPKAVDPLDWPHWRGPEMNGISREKGLISSWSPKGENLVWKQEKLATISTPIVMRGKVYALARSNPESKTEGEKVICADASTGEILWENTFNVYLTDAPAERVAWSSVVGDPETGRVYALGLCSNFFCIDGETGKTVWTRSLSEEAGLLSTYGGRTNVPMLFEDLVVISGVTTGWGENSVPAQRFMAFNKMSGEPVWTTATRLRPPDTTYSTPILGVFNGQRAMVMGSSDGAVHAFQPRTGKPLWSYDASLKGLNQTPVIRGNIVYTGFSEEDASNKSTMGGFLAIDGTGSGDLTNSKNLLWKTPRVESGRAAPLIIDDTVYATTDTARIIAMDIKTGKRIGKETNVGSISMGSPVYGDGKIYVGEKNGRWWILEPSAAGLRVVHKLSLRNEEIQASPIISHGKVYLTTSNAMYCLGKKDQKPSADPIPPAAEETPVEQDPQPAQVQVSPYESLVKPGETVQFTVRLFNAIGQPVKTEAAKFTLKGPGSIDANGLYTAPAGANHTATTITAEVGALKGMARLRSIPPLPWKFDFSDKEIPATWVGMRGRNVFRVTEGEPMMAKITTIPLGTRSQGWFGPYDLHDYTIQADMRGGKNATNGNLPDMGLVNQRYTLDVMGIKQQLQIRSWTSRLEQRFAKTVPFPWKPDTWYTIKFQGENKDGKAILRGKVWPRGEKEPEAWSIEAEDATPNVAGSPGMFGKSSPDCAEILIDNVIVTDNAQK